MCSKRKRSVTKRLIRSASVNLSLKAWLHTEAQHCSSPQAGGVVRLHRLKPPGETGTNGLHRDPEGTDRKPEGRPHIGPS